MLTFVCKTSEIMEEELYRFDINDKALLVTRFDGRYFVSDSICTHEEADLSLGMFTEGALVCPLHRAKFDLKTGSVLSGPDTTSEPIPDLKVYVSKVENGELWVDV
ncbi:MAG: Rieske 2Fe-2S domain-containing protein [Thaumarchaeota archaeon]|nr:Rieske 2Fe-2S domain-containing protein [Nitrososphaerota archaeon]